MIGRDYLERFAKTAADSLVLRRYLTQDFYVDLLATRELYFAPASTFTDQDEGRRTTADKVLAMLTLRRWRLDQRTRATALHAQTSSENHNRNVTLICCWVSGEDECERMWKEKGSTAVSIQTTAGELKRHLGSEFLVKHVAYDRSGPTPNWHSLEPFFLKGPSWAWEREARAVGEMQKGQRIDFEAPSKNHRRVEVNLAALVARIIVSPHASRTYRAEVEERTRNAGVACAVVDSEFRCSLSMRRACAGLCGLVRRKWGAIDQK